MFKNNNVVFGSEIDQNMFPFNWRHFTTGVEYDSGSNRESNFKSAERAAKLSDYSYPIQIGQV